MTIKYTDGKLYKIVDNTTGKCFIGSTCDKTLARKLAQHVTCFNNYKNTWGRKHRNMFEILQNDDYKIVLIENYSCQSKDELIQREDYWIDKTPNNVNNAPKKYKQQWRILAQAYINENFDPKIKWSVAWSKIKIDKTAFRQYIMQKEVEKLTKTYQNTKTQNQKLMMNGVKIIQDLDKYFADQKFDKIMNNNKLKINFTETDFNIYKSVENLD